MGVTAASGISTLRSCIRWDLGPINCPTLYKNSLSPSASLCPLLYEFCDASPSTTSATDMDTREDPLEVLPLEIMQMVGVMLRPMDLVRLSNVNRAWPETD